MKDNAFYNHVSNDRITSRQIDELIGLARGLCADGVVNAAELEFLLKWLAANAAISDQPLIGTLFNRVNEVLSDGLVTDEEHRELFDTLSALGTRDIELGEVLKPTTLPLCEPAPDVMFDGRRFCFTGTFAFGQRRACEQAVIDRGSKAGSLTQSTEFLVIGAYATESWKHSTMGTKIMNACEFRDRGIPISIISESHWVRFL
jgi:NAD-dependent DNA ligase